MKLTKPSRERLHVTRARLWANVYWSITDSSKGANQILLKPELEADKAMKHFDARFGNPLQSEEAKAETPSA